MTTDGTSPGVELLGRDRRRLRRRAGTRRAGCARWPAAPTATSSLDELDEPATRADGRPPRRDGGPAARGRAAAVRARPLGVPPPRPDGRSAGADPAARDRAGRRGGDRPRSRGRPRPLVVADLGTGSGAIGLSLAAELPLDGTTGVADRRRRPTRSTSPGPTSPASVGARCNVRVGAGLVVRRAARRAARRARPGRQQPAVHRRRRSRARRRRCASGSRPARCSPATTGSTTSARSSPTALDVAGARRVARARDRRTVRATTSRSAAARRLRRGRDPPRPAPDVDRIVVGRPAEPAEPTAARQPKRARC